MTNPYGKSDPYSRGYRSGLESRVASQLENLGVEAEYESTRIYYTQPAQKRFYLPDFILPNGIIIETKGRFMPSDRKKHMIIKEQFPELDIRFVFTNPNAPINKGSNTTYEMWCKKNGFLYAKGLIPEEWIKEIPRSCL